MAAQIQRTKTHEDRVLNAPFRVLGSFNYYYFLLPFLEKYNSRLPRLTSTTRHSHRLDALSSHTLHPLSPHRI